MPAAAILLSMLLGATASVPPRPCGGVVDSRPEPQRLAEEMLDLIENSGRDLATFTADLIYTRHEALLDRREIRTGRIISRRRVEDGPRELALLFDTLVLNRRREERRKHVVFSGSWLLEIDHEQKQFIKRQVVPPGEAMDPLTLGEGPFPLPVGQSKEAVLARFQAEAIPVPTEGPLASLAEDRDLRGLRLVPRAGSGEAKDWVRIDLLYDPATWLPVGIDALEVNDDRRIVKLSSLRRNPDLDEADLAALRIDVPDDPAWRVDVRPWRERE